MTTEQLHHHLSAAADDDAAPPTQVTAADVYRTGMRRRTRTRWFTGAAAAATLVVAVAGVSAIVTGPSGGSQVGGAPPQDFTPADTKCRTIAATARDAAASVLPAEVEWSEPTFVEDAVADTDCATGGLFWMPFAYQGADWLLGFEGGTGMNNPGCDTTRELVKCQEIDGGEIGYLDGPTEYGALYSRAGLHFFLGLHSSDEGPLPDDMPFTTDELAVTAEAVATVFS